jgi:hypothetical protein
MPGKGFRHTVPRRRGAHRAKDGHFGAQSLESPVMGMLGNVKADRFGNPCLAQAFPRRPKVREEFPLGGLPARGESLWIFLKIKRPARDFHTLRGPGWRLHRNAVRKAV